MTTFTRQEITWLKIDVGKKLNAFQIIAEDETASPVERQIAQLMRENYASLYGKLLDISMSGAKRIAVK